MNRQSYKLMVVDTDPNSLFELTNQFYDRGFEVHAASNVQQAIEIGVLEKLDLLVTRRRLDIGTGEILLMRLRQQRKNKNMGVLYLSSEQRAGVIMRAINSKPVYSVRLPADIQVLADLAHVTIFSCRFHRPHLKMPEQEVKVMPLPVVSTKIDGGTNASSTPTS